MAKKKTKTVAFVLDCSVSLAWYFKDEANPYADAVASRFPKVQAIVPVIWPLEVANAVLVGERRKRSTEAQATTWLGYLRSLPILVDDETNSRAWVDILAQARTQGLSAYDAAYLELAVRRGLPMATLDSKLKATMHAIGVAEYKP
jgi:predicted nucleic acid-binding protein